MENKREIGSLAYNTLFQCVVRIADYAWPWRTPLAYVTERVTGQIWQYSEPAWSDEEDLRDLTPLEQAMFE